jgi:dienelactone hydrolase
MFHDAQGASTRVALRSNQGRPVVGDAILEGRRAPELWGGLQSGANDIGFTRRLTTDGARRTIIDVWYPARGGQRKMQFGDYLRLSTDLRGTAAPQTSQDERLAVALTGSATGVSVALSQRILNSPMAAERDAAHLNRQFPLVLWTPRYATTVAQSVLSEYLASHGFVVAFPRPETGGKLPYELSTSEEKETELQQRVADMRAAVEYLRRQPFVDARGIGVLAWSYTGEMATRLQLSEPRVKLVAGLSTTLVNDWVFQPPDALESLASRNLTAAYAILTQRGADPMSVPPALRRSSAGYFIEFPGVAHGSFNALEGYVPSLVGISNVQRWSQSSPQTINAYEAAAIIVARLLRHHVKDGLSEPLGPRTLNAGIPDGVAIVR